MVAATSVFKFTSAIVVGILAFGVASLSASPVNKSTENAAHDTLFKRNSAVAGVNGIFQRDTYHGFKIRDIEADLLSEAKRRGRGKGKKKSHHHRHPHPHHCIPRHHKKCPHPHGGTTTDQGGAATSVESEGPAPTESTEPEATGTASDGGADATDSAATPDATAGAGDA